MLVVDRHALLPVDLLHLVGEVLLGLTDALDLEDLLRVERGRVVTGELGSRGHLCTVADAGAVRAVIEVRAARDHVLLFGAVVSDDVDDALALLALSEAHHTRRLGENRRALRRTGFEQLDDARQTVRDVLAGNTAGVERPHGQLRAGLTDRLSSDDADGLTEVDRLARCEHRAVATAAHPGQRLAGEHGPHAHTLDDLVVAEHLDVVFPHLGVARDDRAIGERDVFGQAAAEQSRVEQA